MPDPKPGILHIPASPEELAKAILKPPKKGKPRG